ncbi:MAG: histidinol-phosphatase [Firmicutes bacterium]|nr:histidinol-phosphatase [Bacillota bacterium]
MNNKINCNYHTHSLLCDGKNTLEEMVVSAIANGFETLGFSGHGYTAYDTSYCMSPEGTAEYLAEISRLQKKYADQIEILCGIEQDFGSDEPADQYDYIIGSVHAIFPHAGPESPDNFHGYDRSIIFYVDWDYQSIEKAVAESFGDDPYAFCERYYEMVSQLPEVTGCRIIGHFDLLTKFSEQHSWFDEKHPRYVAAVENALDKLIPQNVVFEINTGAMARGVRTTPYPAPWILRRIAEKGGKIMINSDCHHKDYLNYGFSDAVKLARTCGFVSVKKLTRQGFTDIYI